MGTGWRDSRTQQHAGASAESTRGDKRAYYGAESSPNGSGPTARTEYTFASFSELAEHRYPEAKPLLCEKPRKIYLAKGTLATIFGGDGSAKST